MKMYLISQAPSAIAMHITSWQRTWYPSLDVNAIAMHISKLATRA